MKTHKNLFTQVCSFQNLLSAYKKAKIGARKNDEFYDFYLDLENKLLELSEQLQTQTYQPEKYRYFEIYEPKQRTISVASFTDRIVHHAIVNILEPIYEKLFIYHSYATRKNKGTHKAVFTAQNFLQKNNWFLKTDIQKYFDNINHQILFEIISRKISDKKLLHLIEKIINNSKGHAVSTAQELQLQLYRKVTATSVAPFCFSNIAQMSATKVAVTNSGLPIGNLTSQFFANVYLNELDYFVKHNLKQKFFIRYMDDFVIFNNNNKQILKNILPEIENFLAEKLNLKLKPKSVVINQHTNGLSFLGTRIFRSTIRIKPENLKRIAKNLNKKIYLFHKNKLSEDKLSETCNCYKSFFENYNTNSIKRIIFANKGI